MTQNERDNSILTTSSPKQSTAIFHEQRDFCALKSATRSLYIRGTGVVRAAKGIDYWEFRDGYAVTSEAMVTAIITGYRAGRLKRNELRVFAARLEETVLHKKSRVDLARILNCNSGIKGVRRLRDSEITEAGKSLDTWLGSEPAASSRPVIVSRRVLRHIAQGRSTSNEAVVLLYYMARRVRQAKALERLRPGERYARFTYGELEELSGIPRANVSRSVSRLKDRGWLNTVDVAKQNENVYGQLFVDGALISLSAARRPVNNRGRKKPDDERNDNTPLHETTTLIKRKDPKTRISSFCGKSVEETGQRVSLSAEFERIKRRAEQMKAELMRQVA